MGIVYTGLHLNAVIVFEIRLYLYPLAERFASRDPFSQLSLSESIETSLPNPRITEAIPNLYTYQPRTLISMLDFKFKRWDCI